MSPVGRAMAAPEILRLVQAERLPRHLSEGHSSLHSTCKVGLFTVRGAQRGTKWGHAGLHPLRVN